MTSETAARFAEHLFELEQSLLDATVRADRARVAALLTDDFVEFGSSGTIWTKRAVIEGLASEVPQPSSERSVSDLTVARLADNVALVTYRISRRSDNSRSLRSSIWKKEDGDWRMAFHQGTIVPEEVNE